MINFADKAKNPSFSIAKSVSILISIASACEWLTALLGNRDIYTGPEHFPDALPRTPRRVAGHKRPFPDPRVLQNDRPVHGPGHAQQAQVQPEADPRRDVRGGRAVQGRRLGRLTRFCVGAREVLARFRADER